MYRTSEHQVCYMYTSSSRHVPVRSYSSYITSCLVQSYVRGSPPDPDYTVVFRHRNVQLIDVPLIGVPNPLISTRFHNNPLRDYYPYYQPSHSTTVHPLKKLPSLSYMVRNPPLNLLVCDNNMMLSMIGMIYSRM